MNVYYENHIVGTLLEGANERMQFSYNPEWKEKSTSFPISLSLPFSEDWEPGTVDHFFFSNLLAEGLAKQHIAQVLGVSVENNYRLLELLGQDCAGALIIGDRNSETSDERKLLSDDELLKLQSSSRLVSRYKDLRNMRFSLAGAMDKWAIIYSQSKLFWPATNEPSTHILKMDPTEFHQVSYNEAFSCLLAKELGLATVTITPFEGYSIIERYDRYYDNNDKLVRIHQEDLAQALGYPSSRKYESERGPRIKELASIVRASSTSPVVDVQNVTRWQIFNVLLGNYDGHAKNISLLNTKSGRKLAPLYDLVSTAVYQNTSKELAMSINGQFEIGQISMKDWKGFSNDLGVDYRLVKTELHQLIKKIKTKLPAIIQQFFDRFGNHSIIDEIAIGINKRIRRIKTIERQENHKGRER